VDELKANSCYYHFSDYSWMEDDVKKFLIIRQQGFDKQYDIAVIREKEAEEELELARNAFSVIPFDIRWKKRELLDLRYYFAALMYKKAEHAYALAKAKYAYYTVRLRAMRKSERDEEQLKACQKAEKHFYEAKRGVETARVKYEEMKARSDMMDRYLGWRALLDD